MNIELALLKDLTNAADAVHTMEAAATDAFKVAFTASVAGAATAKAARLAADAAASHAKHEYNAALSAARTHIAAKEPA